MNLENYNSALDLPDTRDIRSEQLFGSLPQVKLPRRVINDQTKPLSQGQRGACTVFGSSGALFETMSQNLVKNGLEYTQPYDPWTVWEEALKKGASDTWGWYIQSALQLILDMNLSNGYTLIGGANSADLYTMKYWLAQHRDITTGSANGDWGAIVRTGVYSESAKAQGHCFKFNGYDDAHVFPNGEKGGFHCPNSWGGIGDFWMPYSMIGRLFSQYIQLGKEDIDALKKAKDTNKALYLEKAKKVWNGERASDIATAEEIKIMLGRANNTLGGRTRKYWADIISEKVIRGKDTVQIWNEKDGKRIIQDMELAIMLTRAVKRDASISSLVLTREQVAVVCGRDFL